MDCNLGNVKSEVTTSSEKVFEVTTDVVEDVRADEEIIVDSESVTILSS